MNNTCYLCNFSFTSRAQLCSHMSSIHRNPDIGIMQGDSSVEKAMPSRFRQNSGTTQLSRAKSSRGISKGSSLHTSKEVLSATVLECNVASTSKRECTLLVDSSNLACGFRNCYGRKGFPTMRGFITHMRKSHPHVQLYSQDVKCRFGCKRYFNNSQQRNLHERRAHEIERKARDSTGTDSQQRYREKGLRNQDRVQSPSTTQQTLKIEGQIRTRLGDNRLPSRASIADRGQSSNKMALSSLLNDGRPGSVSQSDNME